MNVADLRQHLSDLGRLLATSGAKPVAADLAAISDGLAPFDALPLKQFATFLEKANQFAINGQVPVSPTKGKSTKAASGGTKPTPAASPDVDAIRRDVLDIYNRAADPSVTEADIDAIVGRIGGLSKEILVSVADAIELRGMKSKSKPVIISTIRQRIIARKGATQRAGLLDRPAASQNTTESPSTTAANI